MRPALWLAAIPVIVSAGSPAIAAYCESGQMPAPPAVAAQMALPLCGFAATKRWGPNGCQLCDARNVYPKPWSYEVPERRHGDRRGHWDRAYQ
jgi:hypothetical protein